MPSLRGRSRNSAIGTATPGADRWRFEQQQRQIQIALGYATDPPFSHWTPTGKFAAAADAAEQRHREEITKTFDQWRAQGAGLVDIQDIAFNGAGSPGRGEKIIRGLVTKINRRDLNDARSVEKRGGRRMSGAAIAVNLIIQDDTGEVLCQIDKDDYLAVGKKVEEIGRPGKVLYAARGYELPSYRMFKLTGLRFLGLYEAPN